MKNLETFRAGFHPFKPNHEKRVKARGIRTWQSNNKMKYKWIGSVLVEAKNELSEYTDEFADKLTDKYIAIYPTLVYNKAAKGGAAIGQCYQCDS